MPSSYSHECPFCGRYTEDPSGAIVVGTAHAPSCPMYGPIASSLLSATDKGRIDRLWEGAPQDAALYVSTDSGASDTNSGRTPGAPFATLGRARDVLGDGYGVIHLGTGAFRVPLGGLTLASRQALRGLGGCASQVNGIGQTQGTVLVDVAGSRSAVSDLWIDLVPINGTGLRITRTKTGNWPSNEDSIATNVFVGPMGGGATAFGIGTDTNYDVSNIVLINCTSVGNFGLTPTTHMHIGNGESGNVLNILNLGGTSAGNEYGLVINGGGLVSTGMNFGFSSVADIWLKQGSVGAIAISGGRSENSERFLISALGYATARVTKVADYSVVALHNTDGRAVVLGPGPIVLDNIALAGLSAPQFISAEGTTTDGAFAALATVSNCATDHIHPLRSPYSRPGKMRSVRGMQFTADVQYQSATRAPNVGAVRRKNVVDGSGYALNPAYFDAVDVRLGANAGVCTLGVGTVGQSLTLTYEQDGKGGRTWTWPGGVAWDGGVAPVAVAASRNRQSVRLAYGGRCWTQDGAVTNTTAPAATSTPITETFATGQPYWLPAPWELLPGGGSLGVTAGRCTTPSLGWLGDNNLDTMAGLYGVAAAGAVIETGMATQAVGVSATFTWQLGEGVIVHYLDDQTFFTVTLLNGLLLAVGWLGGVSRSYGTHAGPAIAAGESHTLLARCTSTGLAISVDGTLIWTISFGADDLLNFNDLSKHGILSSSRAATFTAFSVT